VAACRIVYLLRVFDIGVRPVQEPHIDTKKNFRSHYGPEVDSASNRNEYQEHFPWVKAAGA